jgi:hypothetical protein
MDKINQGGFISSKQLEDALCKVNCIDVIQSDISWIRKEITDFKKSYTEGHQDLVVRVNKTNGSVAEISKWKERMTGGLVVINAFVVPTVLFLLYKQLSK